MFDTVALANGGIAYRALTDVERDKSLAEVQRPLSVERGMHVLNVGLSVVVHGSSQVTIVC